ncbi:MAG: YebC/PmpR family DNA-binding transcriptional regulator, partial [Firmicutes bacterium HGW-Firmicutes-13]
TTEPEVMEKVKEGLSSKGIEPNIAQVTMVPQSLVEINNEEEAGKILRLMELLEEHDDVQNVYANFDLPEEIMNFLE